METMTQVCAVGSPVAASQTDGSSNRYSYEGIELATDDPEKLIPFVDQLLFFLRVQGYKTRPVKIWERHRVMEIEWSGRKLKAFRDRVLLCVSQGDAGEPARAVRWEGVLAPLPGVPGLNPLSPNQSNFRNGPPPRTINA